MLTLPISQHQLFFAKALTAWLLIAGANLALVVFTVVAIGSIGMLGYPIDGVLSGQLAVGLLRILVACLPMLVVQHAISWRFPNIVLPLAVGVIATMGIMQIGSSQYWVYYPWSYVLMAVNGTDTDTQMQQQALLLAAGLGVLLYGLAAVWLGKRDVA